MKSAFLISGILEILGAFICYFMPDMIYMEAPAYMTRLYGLAALVLGILNILCFLHFSSSKFFRLAYVTVMFFHGSVAMMTYGSPADGIPYKTGAVLTHLALFVIFLMFYLKDLKPENQDL